MKKLILLLVASAAIFYAPASAQTPPKLGSGQVLGNPTASTAQSRPSAIVSVLNAGCTLSPSTCAFFFGYYSPQWFGALCDGTGDDGPAIQSAVDAAAPVVVKLPACTYRVVTPITWTKRKVKIQGAGRYITHFDFEPGADATLFKIDGSAGQTYEHDLRDFSVISADTTHTKTAFRFIDASSVTMYNVSCSRTSLGGGNWTGGTGSICLQTNGRDTSTFQELEFYANKPIALNENPNVYISTDHYVFRDIYLVGDSTGPCITSAAVLTNINFEGRQSWVGCAGGFKAVDAPVSVVGWNNVGFNNVRTEQTTSATAFTIDIGTTTSALRGLWINNSQVDPGMKGIKLRGVLGATIAGVQASCSVASFLDITSSDNAIYLMNNRLEAACTESHGTLTPTNVVANPTGSAVPLFVVYL